MCRECEPRTEEEKTAHETFEAALRAYMTILGADEGILVDWVLVTATSVLGGGETDSTFMRGFSTFNQAPYRTIGLLETHLSRIKSIMFRHDD